MSFISSMLSIIKELKAPPFKIKSYEEDAQTGLIFLWIVVDSKNIPPIKKYPLDILKELCSKKSFSKCDYQKILDTMLENQKRIVEKKFKKKFKLINHKFSEHLEEPLVVYSDLNNKIHIKPAKEIYSSVETIRNFSSEDSACIGNIIGAHEMEQEYRLLYIYNKNNIVNFDNPPLPC